ncbi:LytR/AlgR family response regulator transcription factor [Clostridium sp. Cult3]|uniref:LytR/AlgR family response regulator transcription factor n=1 Tax=Clostridium sp. Cult3 TaxID=2079004 RepID=UPI001F277D5C|nr:LytTR family DNA-binding domain-containing protein [Clostridium sp. Cult3]MCF6460188.1 DNA-binding response regulator [Clostridium sp. Cult3]
MPNTINIAIVDDEKMQVELLKKYVENWADKRDIKTITEAFYNGESFEFSWSVDKRYDVLLLDIEMPGINGVELAKKIRKEDNLINIIFITAIPDYIGEGYDVEAINYLIKPIDENKLYECLDRALQKTPKEEKIILIEEQGGIHRIVQDDILYIESFGHNVEINTTDDKYFIRKNIGAIEKELDENSFVRCHRSYIVNLKHINKIGKDELKLDKGETIPVSRRQYANTNKAFIRYYSAPGTDLFAP